MSNVVNVAGSLWKARVRIYNIRAFPQSLNTKSGDVRVTNPECLSYISFRTDDSFRCRKHISL